MIDVNTLTGAQFAPDGVTSNIAMFQALGPLLQQVGPELPVAVNIAPGSPTVMSINPTATSGGTLPNPAIHYFKPNQAFYFAGEPSTFYYITAANLTATTFTFSTVNNWGRSTHEGAPVTLPGARTSGAIILTGRDITISIPNGAYLGGNYGGPGANVTVTPNGISRIKYLLNNSVFDGKTSFGTPFGPVSSMASPTGTLGVFDYVQTTPTETNVSQLDAVVTFLSSANIASYYVGQVLSFFGLNIQDPFGRLVSGPPNYAYQEFKRVKAIDTTGPLPRFTFDGPLKCVYLSTFPNLFTPNANQVGGGAAMVVPMHPSWDTEITIEDGRWIGQPVATCARRVVYQGCVFQGFGNFATQAAPSVGEFVAYRNHRFEAGGAPGSTYMEVDKMIRFFEIDDATATNKYRILFSSPTLHSAVINKFRGGSILGTPRQIAITHSDIDSLLVGPFIGATETAQVQNTLFRYFDMQGRSDDPGFIRPGNDMTLVPNWTVSNPNGALTFTRNIANLPGSQGMLFQIPGIKLYMADAGNVFKPSQNMGSPFTITNVRMDPDGTFSFDTSLRAVPTRQKSSAVTLASGVVSWPAHGFPAGTPFVFIGSNSGSFADSTLYYLVNPSTDAFSLATHVGGAAITTGDQSSGLTAYANPLAIRVHPCPSFSSIGNSGCAAILDHNGAIDEPLFSRAIRSFIGKQSALGGNSMGFQLPSAKVWGKLKRMTIMVEQASASGTITITSPGFTPAPALDYSGFSQVIDATAAGERTITRTAATGAAGNDILAAYPDWLSGPLVFAWANPPPAAEVHFEVFTDQGITRFANMWGAPNTPAQPGGQLWQWAGASVQQQYGTSP